MKKLALLVLLFVVSAVFAADKSRMEDQTQLPKSQAKKTDTRYFNPPAASELPNNAF